MPRRIDPDLLLSIKVEFESGYMPQEVLGHLRAFGIPVSQTQLYLFWNRWRESGRLLPNGEDHLKIGRPRCICMHMLEVSAWLLK